LGISLAFAIAALQLGERTEKRTMNHRDPQPFGPIDQKPRQTVHARAVSCGPVGDGFSFTFDVASAGVLTVKLDRDSARFFLAGLVGFFPEALSEPVPLAEIWRDAEIAG
jgi:hypothetical protein